MKCLVLVSTESKLIADSCVTFKWDRNRLRGNLDPTIWAMTDFHKKHHNWVEASYLREPLGTGMVAHTWMAALQQQGHHYHHHLILNMFNTTVSLSTRWSAYGSTKAVYRLKLSLVIKGMYIYIIWLYFYFNKNTQNNQYLSSDQILNITVKDAHRSCDVDRRVKSRLTF